MDTDKRKRNRPSKLKESELDMKRPRGRPVNSSSGSKLSRKKVSSSSSSSNKTSNKNNNNAAASFGNHHHQDNYGAYSDDVYKSIQMETGQLGLSYHGHEEEMVYAGGSGGDSTRRSTSGSKSRNNTSSSSSNRAIPTSDHIASVTRPLLCHLMKEEPSTIQELAMSFPVISRETIQSTLDVLKVLGLVKQLKPAKIDERASSLPMQQPSGTGQSLYSLTEYARFPHEVDLLSVAQQIKSTETRTKNTRVRIRKFKEIADAQDMSPESKLRAVRAVIQDAKEKDNSQEIADDPVFKIFE